MLNFWKAGDHTVSPVAFEKYLEASSHSVSLSEAGELLEIEPVIMHFTLLCVYFKVLKKHWRASYHDVFHFGALKNCWKASDHIVLKLQMLKNMWKAADHGVLLQASKNCWKASALFAALS